MCLHLCLCLGHPVPSFLCRCSCSRYLVLISLLYLILFLTLCRMLGLFIRWSRHRRPRLACLPHMSISHLYPLPFFGRSLARCSEVPLEHGLKAIFKAVIRDWPCPLSVFSSDQPPIGEVVGHESLYGCMSGDFGWSRHAGLCVIDVENGATGRNNLVRLQWRRHGSTKTSNAMVSRRWRQQLQLATLRACVQFLAHMCDPGAECSVCPVVGYRSESAEGYGRVWQLVAGGRAAPSIFADMSIVLASLTLHAKVGRGCSKCAKEL